MKILNRLQIHNNISIRMLTGIIILILAGSVIISCVEVKNNQKKGSSNLLVLVGSYSQEDEEGISLLSVETGSGELKLVSGAVAGENPSYLCLSPDNKLIYAVNESGETLGRKGGGLTTLSFSREDSSLSIINTINIEGEGPCHISTDVNGEFLFLSNYDDGSLSVVSTDSSGVPDLITALFSYYGYGRRRSHIHMAKQDPESKELVVSDLGRGRLYIYRLNYSDKNIFLHEESTLRFPRGSGPRHFEFSGEGEYLYVINELSSEIIVLMKVLTGDYTMIQSISTLPEKYDGENFCADIHLSPDGRFLYASNRGNNTIAAFRIQDTGKLTIAGFVNCEGDWPRNFAIDKSGQIMIIANQRSNNLPVFKINNDTGLPVYSGHSLDINSPSCIIFVDDK
jgi:6-phosphogluconolactonase